MQRILQIVREPMAGEIRLQWWRDAISNGDRSVPLAAALNITIEKHRLPVTIFDALLDARISDLYADPPATLVDAEGHAGETRSVVYQMAVQIVHGVEAGHFSERSGHAGVLSYWLDALAMVRSSGVVRRAPVPRDTLQILNINPDEPFDPAQLTSSQRAGLEDWLMCEARRHRLAVFADWRSMSSQERMPFLDLVPMIKSAKAAKAQSPIGSLWSIWRAASGTVPGL